MPHTLHLQFQYAGDASPFATRDIDFEDILLIDTMETPDHKGDATIVVYLKPLTTTKLFREAIECPVSPSLDIKEICAQMKSVLKHQSQDAYFLFVGSGPEDKDG